MLYICRGGMGLQSTRSLKKKHIKNTFFPGFVNWWLKPHAPGFNINIKYSVCFPVTTRNTWRRYLLASVGPWHSLFSSSLEKWAELAAPPVICTNTLPPFFFSPPWRPFDYVPVACMAFGGHQVMITLGVLLLIDAGIRSNRQQRERLLVWKWGQLWSDLPAWMEMWGGGWPW